MASSLSNNDQCLPVTVAGIVTDNGAKYNGDISLQEFDAVLPSTQRTRHSLLDPAKDDAPDLSSASDFVAQALSLIHQSTPRSRSASEPSSVWSVSRARTSTVSYPHSSSLLSPENLRTPRRKPSTTAHTGGIALPVTYEEDKEELDTIEEPRENRTPLKQTTFNTILTQTGGSDGLASESTESPESVKSFALSTRNDATTISPFRLDTRSTLSGLYEPSPATPLIRGLSALVPRHYNSQAHSSPFMSDLRWQDRRSNNSYFRYSHTDIEQRAHGHRHSAAQSEPKFAWSGNLPVKVYRNPVYSPKVFLGGMPYEVTENQIIDAFKKYGTVTVQWPPKQQSGTVNKAGFVYVIFEHDRNVKSLISECTVNQDGKYYFPFNAGPNRRKKDVQVIPWVISDSNYIKTPSQRLDQTKTVFVGALHGMLTAEGLANIMNDLFNNVAYVGIDTDKYKYPMGSARVTFTNNKSYSRAVTAGFVDVKSTRFNKKIQIDPYIDSGPCVGCQVSHGPVFCREPACMNYYCYACWEWTHSTPELRNHRPLMRARRNDTTD